MHLFAFADAFADAFACSAQTGSDCTALHKQANKEVA